MQNGSCVENTNKNGLKKYRTYSNQFHSSLARPINVSVNTHGQAKIQCFPLLIVYHTSSLAAHSPTGKYKEALPLSRPPFILSTGDGKWDSVSPVWVAHVTTLSWYDLSRNPVKALQLVQGKTANSKTKFFLKNIFFLINVMPKVENLTFKDLTWPSPLLELFQNPSLQNNNWDKIWTNLKYSLLINPLVTYSDHLQLNIWNPDSLIWLLFMQCHICDTFSLPSISFWSGHLKSASNCDYCRSS